MTSILKVLQDFLCKNSLSSDLWCMHISNTMKTLCVCACMSGKHLHACMK